MKSSLKLTAQIVLLIATSVVLTRCGQQMGASSSTCMANVIEANMRLAVQKIGAQSYRFTLCGSMDNPAPYSVYGAPSSSDLSQNNVNQANVRKPTISDAFSPNDTFQVDFRDTDNYFAIYYDQDLGGGNFRPSSLIGIIVNPRAIPRN